MYFNEIHLKALKYEYPVQDFDASFIYVFEKGEFDYCKKFNLSCCYSETIFLVQFK